MSNEIVIPEQLWNVPVVYRITAIPEQPDFTDINPLLKVHMIEDINAGKLQSFSVLVELQINYITLGTDHLSGCFYKDLQEFIDLNDYYADMKYNCQCEAYHTLMALRSIIINLPSRR